MRQADLDAFRAAEATPIRRGARGEKEKPSQPSRLAERVLAPWSKPFAMTMEKYCDRQHFIRDAARANPLPLDCPASLRLAIAKAWAGDTSLLCAEAYSQPSEAARRSWASFLRQSVSFPTLPNSARWQLDFTSNEDAREAFSECVSLFELRGPSRTDRPICNWILKGKLTPEIKEIFRDLLKRYQIDPTDFLNALEGDRAKAHSLFCVMDFARAHGGGRKTPLWRNHAVAKQKKTHFEKNQKKFAKRLREKIEPALRRIQLEDSSVGILDS